MPPLPHEQRSPEWFAARKGRVTASLAAACIGLDPHTGPLSAFNQITGRTGGDSNQHTRWGVEFESTARSAYEVLSGNFVTETGLWVHADLDWLAASPDGLIGTDGLVEIKCPSHIPDAVPPHHEIQCRVQMACTDRFWVDYFAWSQDGELCRRIERDIHKETELISRLHGFYLTFIKPDLAPPRRRPAATA